MKTMKFKQTAKTYKIKKASGNQICSPRNMHSVLRDDYNPLQEEMYILCLNNRNQVIDKFMVAKGSINSVSVDTSSIFRTILLNGANHFAIAHNHPSEDTAPSEEDIIFTRKIVRGAVILDLNLLDHMVYSKDGYFSFKEHSLL